MTSDHITSLNSLVVRVEESINAYIWASENSANPATTAEFLNSVNQREHALKHLKNEATRLEGHPVDGGKSDSAENKHFIGFRDAFTKSDQKAIEAEIRREDEALKDAFQSLLNSDLDESLRAELHQSFEIVKQSSVRLSVDD